MQKVALWLGGLACLNGAGLIGLTAALASGRSRDEILVGLGFGATLLLGGAFVMLVAFIVREVPASRDKTEA